MFVYGEREGERDYSLALGTRSLDPRVCYPCVSISDSTRSQCIGREGAKDFLLNLDI